MFEERRLNPRALTNEISDLKATPSPYLGLFLRPGRLVTHPCADGIAMAGKICARFSTAHKWGQGEERAADPGASKTSPAELVERRVLSFPSSSRMASATLLM